MLNYAGKEAYAVMEFHYMITFKTATEVEHKSDDLANANGRMALGDDRKLAFLLQALDGVIESLGRRCELLPKVLQLLVGELVWFLPWINLIRTPATVLMRPVKES